MASAAVARKLSALRYPRATSYAPTDMSEVVALVAFLEDRCVRAWDIDARTPLRRVDAAWHDAFARYLTDVECPHVRASTDASGAEVGGTDYRAERLQEYVEWLISHAIACNYEDKATEINTGATAAVREAAHTRAPSEADAAAAAAAEPLIRELAALLHVNAEGRTALEALQAAHRVIRQRVVPAAAVQERAAQVGSKSRAAGGEEDSTKPIPAGRRAAPRPGPLPSAKEVVDLASFPLGFSTSNEIADKAAAVLRMLYVADLRELQDAVNDILVSVQEFTANPKTDASLGVVGK